MFEFYVNRRVIFCYALIALLTFVLSHSLGFLLLIVLGTILIFGMDDLLAAPSTPGGTFSGLVCTRQAINPSGEGLKQVQYDLYLVKSDSRTGLTTILLYVRIPTILGSLTNPGV